MRLNINIDHVATLRNQRDSAYPDPLRAALLCREAGADGITVHLREDRRHIRDQDVARLSAADVGVLNLEMAATPEMTQIMARVRPDVVTLVPEKREERTTEGGLDVRGQRAAVLAVARACQENHIKLSLFIEADTLQVQAAREVGAQQVEFHTGHYCESSEERQREMLSDFRAAAKLAQSLGLEVAAGHGLNVDNVGPIAAISEITELNIGHSVIADSVFMGLAEAVRRLRASIDSARGR